MNPFIYQMPVKVYFGVGGVDQHLPAELKNYGETVMLVYGGRAVKEHGILDQVKRVLEEAGKRVVELGGVAGNPTYASVQEGIALHKREKVDLMLAIGGGSVVDCTKIIAAGALCDEDLWTMMIDEKRKPEKMARFAVVLTISGAGAEMDDLGACTCEDRKLKRTFRGPYADFVIEDPSYLMTVPLHVFTPGVFDSLSHCMESYFGTGFNVWDEINESLMRHIVENGRQLMVEPDSLEIRSNLMWDASLIQMFSFYMGKPGDFNAHRIEGALVTHTNSTHGIGLAIIQPVYYRQICHGDEEKFARFATRVMDVDPEGMTLAELAEAGVDALETFIETLGLPSRFSEAGIEVSDELLDHAAETAELNTGNVQNITCEEVRQILEACR